MTKELDRRFRHVGRIKRSWGTQHKPTIRRMEDMVSTLFEIGRLDILRQIQDGTLTPLQVYDAYRANELNRLPTAATMAPLKESMEKWIAKKECSASHGRSLSQSLRHVLSCFVSAPAVGDLPSALSKLREKMQGKHPRSYNLARAAAQAFAKTTAGKHSKLWQDVTAVEVLKGKSKRTKHPALPGELREMTQKMTPEYSEIAWAMASTGMGFTELWGGWEVKLNHIAIHGTKRGEGIRARERIVPLLMPISRPTRLYPAFRKALAKVGPMRPYDLRRTYGNWLEASGIPHSRAIQYMGHATTDMTDIYQWHEVARYLEEDAARLKDYVFGSSDTKLKLEKA